MPRGEQSVQPFSLYPFINTPLLEAIVNSNSAADQTIVAAASGQTTRVYACFLIGAAAIGITVKRGSTALSGVMTLAAGIPLILPFMGVPWFTTGANEAFVLTTTAIQLSGRVYYLQD